MLYYSLIGIIINHLFLIWTYLSTPTHDSAMIDPWSYEWKGRGRGVVFPAWSCPQMPLYPSLQTGWWSGPCVTMTEPNRKIAFSEGR